MLSSPHQPCSLVSCYYLELSNMDREGVYYLISWKPSPSDPNSKLVICRFITSSDQHLSLSDFCAYFWQSGCHLGAERSLEGLPAALRGSALDPALKLPAFPSCRHTLPGSSTHLGSSTPLSGFGSFWGIGNPSPQVFETASSFCPQ